MAGKVGKDFQDFMSKNTQFTASLPQTMGQVAGSYAAIMAVEPLFYPKPQGSIVSQQLDQRLGMDALLRHPSNPLYRRLPYDTKDDGKVSIDSTGGYAGPGYSSGTLYQLGGTPMRGM